VCLDFRAILDRGFVVASCVCGRTGVRHVLDPLHWAGRERLYDSLPVDGQSAQDYMPAILLMIAIKSSVNRDVIYDTTV
jgi:hypothetical protein